MKTVAGSLMVAAMAAAGAQGLQPCVAGYRRVVCMDTDTQACS